MEFGTNFKGTHVFGKYCVNYDIFYLYFLLNTQLYPHFYFFASLDLKKKCTRRVTESICSVLIQRSGGVVEGQHFSILLQAWFTDQSTYSVDSIRSVGGRIIMIQLRRMVTMMMREKRGWTRTWMATRRTGEKGLRNHIESSAEKRKISFPLLMTTKVWELEVSKNNIGCQG